MSKFSTWAKFILGCALMVIGIVFSALYILEAFIKRVGEPDQSLIFWYVPILFIGLICFGIGTSLILYSRTKR